MQYLFKYPRNIVYEKYSFHRLRNRVRNIGLRTDDTTADNYSTAHWVDYVRCRLDIGQPNCITTLCSIVTTILPRHLCYMRYKSFEQSHYNNCNTSVLHIRVCSLCYNCYTNVLNNCVTTMLHQYVTTIVTPMCYI